RAGAPRLSRALPKALHVPLRQAGLEAPPPRRFNGHLTNGVLSRDPGRLRAAGPLVAFHIGGMSPGIAEGSRRIRIPSPTIASANGTSMTALAGMSFWARMMTAITDIQMMLIAPSATSIAINPMLEPAQQTPNSNPDRTNPRH